MYISYIICDKADQNTPPRQGLATQRNSLAPHGCVKHRSNPQNMSQTRCTNLNTGSSPHYGRAAKQHATRTHTWPKTPRDVCSRSTLEKVSKPERGFTHPAQSWLSSRPRTHWESCTELPRLLAAEISQMQCLEKLPFTTICVHNSRPLSVILHSSL